MKCIRKGMCCCCRDGLSCLKDLDCLDKKKDLKNQGMGVVEVTVNVGKEGKTITSFRPQWLCHSCTFSNEVRTHFIMDDYISISLYLYISILSVSCILRRGALDIQL